MHTVLIRLLCVLDVVINWRCHEGNVSDVLRRVTRQYRKVKLDD
jgi:hypothetical protein